MKKTTPTGNMTIHDNPAKFLVYQADHGGITLEVRLENETLWLTQKAMAELFGVSVKTISEHLQNIFKSLELQENSVIRNFRITAADDKRYKAETLEADAVYIREMRRW